MKEKLRIVFRPFVLILICLTIGYTFLHWLLIIELSLFQPKEIVSNFLIPIILTALISWIYIPSRLKVLKLKWRRRDWRLLYSCIAWIALTIPLTIAQSYMESATGKLTELDSIKEINRLPPTKYYTVKRWYIDKKRSSTHFSYNVSGRYSQYFKMDLYMSIPLLDSEKDTATNNPCAWLGVSYHKTISNRLKENRKTEEINDFIQISLRLFNNKDVSDISYLERIGNTDDRDGYLQAISQGIDKRHETILIGVQEPFNNRNGNKLESMLIAAFAGTILWLFLSLKPQIDPKELKRIKAGKPDRVASRNFGMQLSYIKPHRDFLITPIIIYINIAVFWFLALKERSFIHLDGANLMKWGANFRPLVQSGEWWRLLTNTFLHGGIIHLAANMLALYVVGVELEPKLGRRKFSITYLLIGILSSITSVWWHENTISVGSSGAILGLYGVLLALLLTKTFPGTIDKPFLLSTTIFVGINLTAGLAVGIDNAAHIGGLISGFVLGLTFLPTIRKGK